MLGTFYGWTGKAMTLPDWLEKYREQWTGFCEMRERMEKKHRVPWTERAAKVTVTELERLRIEGYDVGQVLDQSTQRGWRGVFAVYGQEPKRVLRDQHGTYEVTSEGFRRYTQLQ